MPPAQALARGFTHHGYVYGIPVYLTEPSTEPITIVATIDFLDPLLPVIDALANLVYRILQRERQHVAILVGPAIDTGEPYGFE